MANEELLEEEIEILSLTDENGNETKFEYLDCIEYAGKEYLVLLPAEVFANSFGDWIQACTRTSC